MAARDKLLREAREVASDGKDRLSRVRVEAEEEARRAAEAESMAASEGGRRCWRCHVLAAVGGVTVAPAE